MQRYNRIKEKLSVIEPSYLEVIDETILHQNHWGNTNVAESHFRIIIASKHLHGYNLFTQHKKINDILREEFNKGLHALTIKIKES